MNSLNFIAIVILIASVLFTSADSKSQTINGNGIVSKEKRNVSSFSKIEINSVMNVFLKQTSEESVTIESDNNLFPYIETFVKDNTLIIEIKDKTKFNKYDKMNLYVNFKDINNLENNSVGNVKSENKLELTSFSIENNSVGNLDLDLNCQNLNVDINSVGNVTFSGKAVNVNISNNSVGNLDAFDMTAENMVIENNSVGNSNVYVTGEISIESNGVGNVFYKGNPKVKSLDKSGVGSVKKL